MTRLLAELRSPLARWGLLALTALAAAGGATGPALAVGTAAAVAWIAHTNHTPGRNRR
ncbi:hypothetical protein [Streptomyces bohaiensis]|uniref:Uncharacterized protein n=1 Tax=Streptomyces bohaiensis TaxID=1431344 RepID=A0ABX1C4T2_9ACTN|nr:hypothetical protein [Streptomyces bohaiensis]NJQ14207.1 hypothetical protein [Streptomyces bohaiensis]